MESSPEGDSDLQKADADGASIAKRPGERGANGIAPLPD